MLPARAAETLQHIAGDIMPPRDRDLLDRIGHIVDGDADEALGNLARCLPHQSRDLSAPRQRGFRVDRLIPVRPEHRRKMLRPDLAKHDIAVGDRQRPAAPVAGRPRHCPRTLRPDPETLSVIDTDGATPSRDRMDLQHRRPHAHACHRPLAGPLIGARIMGDIGRGAAHVEPDDMIEPGLLCSLRHADDPAGRAGQDRILAPEPPRIGQPAIGLHEEQAPRP